MAARASGFSSAAAKADAPSERKDIRANVNQLYLAEIYDGRKQAARDEGGSGFLLGKNLILTAHHVIGFAGAPVPPGETGYDVRAIGDFREGRTEWLKARVCWDDPGRDLALLEVIPPADPATIVAAATTPRFGRLSGQEELPWSATGFPLVRKQGERNEALPVSGGLDPGAAAKKLSVDLAVHSALIPRRAEDWGGMSGAAVFVADCLVGVLVAVSDEYQQTALSLSLIEGVLNDIMFRAALAGASGKQRDCWTISGTAGAITATPAIEDPEIDDRIAAIGQEHRGPLFGRRDALIALDSYIASPRERPFVLRAPSGYGKTALLATWERHLQARGAAVVAHYFSDDRGTSSSLRCLRRLKRQLRTARRQIVLGERQPTDVDAAYTELYQTLTEHPSQSGPLVIILDGLDEADSMMPPLFVGRLPDHLWLVIALHGPANADPSWIAKWTTGATELPLTLLDRSAVQDWLGNAWSQQGRPSQISTASTDEVWTRTEGYPLFLHYLVPLLQTQRDDQGLLAALRQVPPAFHNYVGGELIKLAEVADRLGSVDTYRIHRAMAAIVTTAR
jgi:AAA ATPase domain/Trypsin-like peptidase domain